MRYFLTLLLLFFAASTAGAQTVTIPDEVSRWFLEQDDKVSVLQTQVTTLKLEILSLKHQVKIQQTTVSLHVDDSKILKALIDSKQEQLSIKEKELRSARREITKQKILKVLGWATAAVLAVLLGISATNG